MRLFLLLGLISILTCAGLAAEPDWLKKMREIKLMSDTYDEVIKILGTPSDGTVERALSETFDYKEGKMWVNFASGLCVVTPYSDGKPVGWKVPQWTVINIDFELKKPISRKKLGISFSGFIKHSIDDMPGTFVYRSDELGIEYYVTVKGEIESIGFYPATKFNHLHCPEISNGK